jgi:cellulase/cellobiase CelA1
MVFTLVRAAGLLAFAAVIGAGVTGTANAASGTAAADCTGTAQIVSLTLDPPTATQGQTSTATLVAQSCTGQSQPVHVQWYGIFQGSSGTGIPPGCPAIDPFLQYLTLPATGVLTTSFGFQVFTGCTATSLRVTGSLLITGSGTVEQSAVLTITGNTPPPPTCSVAYTRQSEWGGGFVSNVTITNGATTAIDGWTLGFTFGGDQVVTNAWGATVTQSGAVATARNASWDGHIAAGGTVSFGFQGTWQASDATPTSFTLNGTACTVR